MGLGGVDAVASRMERQLQAQGEFFRDMGRRSLLGTTVSGSGESPEALLSGGWGDRQPLQQVVTVLRRKSRLRGQGRGFLAEGAAGIEVGVERQRPVGLEQRGWEERGRKGR